MMSSAPCHGRKGRLSVTFMHWSGSGRTRISFFQVTLIHRDLLRIRILLMLERYYISSFWSSVDSYNLENFFSVLWCIRQLSLLTIALRRGGNRIRIRIRKKISYGSGTLHFFITAGSVTLHFFYYRRRNGFIPDAVQTLFGSSYNSI